MLQRPQTQYCYSRPVLSALGVNCVEKLGNAIPAEIPGALRCLGCSWHPPVAEGGVEVIGRATITGPEGPVPADAGLA